MSAFRILSRFAELLDINVTRAAAAWLRLNADGTVTERTAAQTLSDLGGISVITNAAVLAALATNAMPAGAWGMGVGWTDNGDGTYTSANATGYNAITSPPTPRSSFGNGVWVLACEVIALTSGGLQAYWAPSGNIPFQSVGSANFAGSTLIFMGTQKMDADHRIYIRCNNGFVGTIGNLRLMRLF